MKILNVRFENLNSLAGCWSIDFTHPEYLYNSIFAITGPTGSGKTTLLDAISLALYGRTPRLNSVTKSTNEILTRRTGHCFAEVTFATLKGQFRCHWSQHRSRKKPDGDLQQPKHEIVNHETNEVLENRIKDVGLAVERVTGMNFGQFTRSILLAQGNFAAFLQAPADERAPLLEQITGTEIYSRISQKVYEHAVEMEKIMHDSQKSIDSVAVLSAEEERKYQQELKELQSEAELLQHEIDQRHTALVWHDNLTSLRGELELLENRRKSVEKKMEASLPRRTQLDRALQALKVKPIFDSLIAARERQEEELSELATIKKQSTSTGQNQEKLNQRDVHLSQIYKEREEQQTEEKKRGNIVRKIDSQLEGLVNLRWEHAEQVKKAEERQAETEKQKKTVTHTLEGQRKSLQIIQQYLNENQQDSALIESLPVIQEQTKHLTAIDIGRKRLIEKHTNCVEQQKIQELQLAELQKLIGQNQHVLAGYEKDHNRITAALAQLVGQQPLTHSQLEELRQQQNAYDRLEAILASAEKLNAELSLNENEITALHQTAELLSTECQSLAKHIVTQEKLIKSCEENFFLSLRIASYEEDRKHLKHMTPCPLCGSLEHPFTAKMPEQKTDGKDELEQLKQELSGLQSTNEKIIGQIAENRSAIRNREEQRAALLRQITDGNKEKAKICASLGLHDNKMTLESLRDDIQQLHQQYEQFMQLLAKKDSLTKKEEQLRGKITESHKNLLNLQRQKDQLDNSLRNSQEKVSELNEQTEELGRQITSQFGKLLRFFNTYGHSATNVRTLDKILSQLEKRQGYWQEQQQKNQRLTLDIKVLEERSDSLSDQLYRMKTEVAQNAKKSNELDKNLASLREQRYSLYEEKDPDMEEKQLKEILDELSKQRKEITEKLAFLSGETSRLNERRNILQKSIERRSRQLTKEEALWADLLAEKGYSDTDDFLRTLLPATTIDEHTSILAELDGEAASVATLISEKQATLAKEEAKNLSRESRPMLTKAIAALQDEQHKKLQRLGSVQARLEENNRLQLTKKDLLLSLVSQKKELTRWQRLNTLIGSASGKKFRNFAQGITFDCVVRYANRSLEKMTDRYILIRHETAPLDLDIIDNYRGGDIRSTKNLSGGESFLVSLALALGLSSMAGENVRVDSLFLDEGFGTLDEETLEVALQTLASLQQQGKMIGIISHVSLLKERLATQIHVVPDRGGRSFLAGPGVRSM